MAMIKFNRIRPTIFYTLRGMATSGRATPIPWGALVLENDVALVGEIEVIPTLLDVVCRTTGMGFAAIARVTSDRWIACQVKDDIGFGLAAGGELVVETTICHEIRQHQELVVIDDVDADPLYATHHTPQLYGLKSYISIPIYHHGEFFGTLCAIDPHPHKLNTPAVVGMFRLFADLIGFHLDSGSALRSTQVQLAQERHDAQLREQFIAVLGHDLRNPLAAISAGAQALRRSTTDERTILVTGRIEKSVQRMNNLIEDILDFARGRLGGGIPVASTFTELNVDDLEQAVAELRQAWPESRIDLHLTLNAPFMCDSKRMAQLLSNLLANALVHGAASEPVTVCVRSESERFTLSVTNKGSPIPAALMPTLFKPFVRASTCPDMQGLGLGLYIASEIARAHGGSLSVNSDDEATQFLLTVNSPGTLL
ncbi:GAF domain-containing sensor histidine kinase [Silvimonas amylolytica]|uniref:histidine kinase n=1 Tax=Silvimonas amylolytica TaxID=449663 RepID=A0ABQ2PM03_9NEIS|nr:GAF domain-containing sensor histidine kinase [Silvimonas amylolytica]GGP26009.1 sensor histidine kinase [Silvimonas amylolytica]